MWREVSARPDAPLDDPEFGLGGRLDAEWLRRGRDAKHALYGNAIQPVSPLYVSSICKEKCAYCNYRAGSEDPGLKRVRLSLEELEREVRFLVAERGLRAVELVYASDPLIGVEQMEAHIALTKSILNEHGGGRVGLSAEPMEVEDYARLKAAGLAFSVVWQETYDPARYAELHPGRQVKSDYAYRLDSFGRMLEAGLEDVGIGVLSGLADWRKDWSMLMRHEDWLRRRYGRGASILGVPRLKAAPGAVFQEFGYAPSDNAFRALVALHKARFPEVRPFVSTREEFEMCLQLAGGGGCLFTFNCSVVPGGYTLDNAGAQFVTGNFDALEYGRRVEQAGFRVDWDWSLCYTTIV
ncbi:MAG TPA: radical SAM protein [Paludibaculum sp.]|jgi:2-iminoacetate synthase